MIDNRARRKTVDDGRNQDGESDRRPKLAFVDEFKMACGIGRWRSEINQSHDRGASQTS
jgi:hypothetical protein